jgi:predicted nucleic acid-binding protein
MLLRIRGRRQELSPAAQPGLYDPQDHRLLIATFYLTTGHMLLHHDHDFDPFERELGLCVVHP